MTREPLKGEITMKTKEELIELKTECEMLGKKLRELSVDELAQVTGGSVKIGGTHMVCSYCNHTGLMGYGNVGVTTYCPECGKQTYTGKYEL